MSKSLIFLAQQRFERLSINPYYFLLTMSSSLRLFLWKVIVYICQSVLPPTIMFWFRLFSFLDISLSLNYNIIIKKKLPQNKNFVYCTISTKLYPQTDKTVIFTWITDKVSNMETSDNSSFIISTEVFTEPSIILQLLLH